jgi:hypothetical protein
MDPCRKVQNRVLFPLVLVLRNPEEALAISCITFWCIGDQFKELRYIVTERDLDLL